MNIFVLDTDPAVAARALCDKHVVKMALETAQIMSTVLAQHGVVDPDLYRSTHRAHPCTRWAAEARANYQWLANHGLAICDEYSRRYGKEHASRRVIRKAESMAPVVPAGSLTSFAQAMPDEYRREDPVEAYRAYYRGAKANIATWKAPAETPLWFKA
jgi:hypothetical protein